MENLKKFIIHNLFRKDNKLNNWYRKYITPEVESQIIFITQECSGNLPEKIYWVLNDLTAYPLCLCGNKITKFYNNLYRYNKTCCNECRKKLIGKSSSLALNNKTKIFWNEVEAKRKITNSLKYNNSNYRNLQQQKQTIINKYGVSNISKLISIQKKKEDTCLKNNGYTHWFKSEKGREFVIHNNKTRNYTMSLETHQKWLSSCLTRKDYELPSGKIIKLQGYEPIVMDLLLNEISEHDIITDLNKMPVVIYKHNNKNKRYFPDIWLHKLNTIIEVKSTYTMSLHYSKNMEKAKRCNEMGLNIHFYILDKTHELDILKFDI